MKKIIFCLQTMLLGGVERELITVLKKIHNDYDITLLLLYQEDAAILREIPKSVKIEIIGIEKRYYCEGSASLVKQRLRKGKICEAAAIAIKRCLGVGMSTSNTNIDNVGILNELFDVAVCYHIHSPLLLRYVAEKVQANRKIAWIHNDFYNTGYPIEKLKKYVLVYNEFVAVSKKVENEFRKLCPWYAGGISTAYNYLDSKEIIALSNAVVDDKNYLNEQRLKILTVGRFAEEKGIDLAIIVSSMLKKANLGCHWYVIGYGELEETYRKLIDKYDVSDCFTILGKKYNPYPYIKKCDIYVQPSRHEAFGLVIKEAKILGRPIVCTNFAGADEQIINGINGVIVPVNDTTALFEAISKLIHSPDTRKAMSNELKKWFADNDLKEIKKHFE